MRTQASFCFFYPNCRCSSAVSLLRSGPGWTSSNSRVKVKVESPGISGCLKLVLKVIRHKIMSNNKFLSVFYTKLSSSAPQTTKQPSSSEKKLFKTWHGNTPTSQYYCFYCTLRKHVVCFLTFPSEGLWASWDFKKVKFSVFVYKYMLFFFFLWICGNPMDL